MARKSKVTDPAREWNACHPEPVHCPICEHRVYLPLDPARHIICTSCQCRVYNDGKNFIVSWTSDQSLFRNRHQ